MKHLLLLFTLAFGLAHAQTAPLCASEVAAAEAEVTRQRMAKDDLGAFRSIGDRALEGLAGCPESARLWYLAARAAEVLEPRFDGLAFAHHGGLHKIVADAMVHVPRDVRVATIAARLDGSSRAARKALALDPDYPPARQALALALAYEGQFDEALERVAGNPTGASAQLARARVLLLAGQPEQALNLARQIRPIDPDEPTPSADVHRDAQEIIGFALLAQRRTQEARRALLAAASAGSQAARRQLAR